MAQIGRKSARIRLLGRGLSVLNKNAAFLKTLAFAFESRLCSKTRRSKTRLSGRRLPNGKPHCLRLERGFPRGQGLRSGPLRSKSAAFCVFVLKPTKGGALVGGLAGKVGMALWLDGEVTAVWAPSEERKTPKLVRINQDAFD